MSLDKGHRTGKRSALRSRAPQLDRCSRKGSCSWRGVDCPRAGASDQRKFDQDRWELFDLAKDRSESTDLSAQHLDKVKELAALWLEEATKNKVMALIDLGVHGVHALEFTPHRLLPQVCVLSGGRPKSRR
jgi:hypothetical protein